VIGIRQDEENVLNDAEEVLLEEGVGNYWIGISEIIDNLQADF
jgi:hypothetical protein